MRSPKTNRHSKTGLNLRFQSISRKARADRYAENRSEDEPAPDAITEACRAAILEHIPDAQPFWFRTKCRKRDMVQVRQLFHSLMYLNFSKIFGLDRLGQLTNGCDHASVIHSIGQVQDLRDTSRAYNKLYSTIEDTFLQNVQQSIHGEEIALWRPVDNIALSGIVAP